MGAGTQCKISAGARTHGTRSSKDPGLLKQVPVICGGYSNFHYFDECYKVTANKAVLLGKLSSKRKLAASVVINNYKLWITGGSFGNPLSSTEFIHLSGTISIGISGWKLETYKDTAVTKKIHNVTK